MSIPISSADFRRATGMFPSLQPLATSGNLITAIAVVIGGISGSKRSDRVPVSYRVLASVRSLETALPPIWIASPEDSRIKHRNIYRAREVCPFNGRKMPTLCWGDTPKAWRGTATAERGLANLLEAVRQVLANVNPDSPAR
ncbi:hypothetical protein [Paractinoplanes brasiliensis]|uniref:Uncharacterized protein n=1 Tax=Paractinoplanes brasiliensis TaxID=52695 RepID=A0A4R6JYY6_9ACTN|nr:hypothetical protein [Actinoplanes brasiliensis]MDY7083633.1 hypothetical protein [Actinomycetota bacterium]TDO42103.1 hypothetical protein C8E87_5866 [Actinoplanes brasiliensis]GID32034.1 hypothetical protein Abr02nite_70170 [Actinoplanes brasiliensis]